ncbi:MAG TPA: asparagine synthase (glutamine-hydrolyzing) [Cyclobacteriaceae bacterium]|nr:asparagine synthase (glutamine-hydrolyzing) [Cyclobacteriaceae bacterium]
MSGITGVHAYNEIGRFHLINLQKSVDCLKHRGPDSQGSQLYDRAGMGYRRLAVIDTSPEANKPLTDPSGRYSIVFDGDVLNYRHIREDLKKEGAHFITNTSNETVLHSFIRHGIDCLDKLMGSFAFAIYDRENDEMLLARDRFGVKPLLYFHDEDKLIFASEIASLLALGVEKSINWNSLPFYFQLGFIPAPLTIIHGIHKLLPGHYLISRSKNINIFSYYELIPGGSGLIAERENLPGLRELLERSVDRCLVSEIPAGVYLSGGFNSSAVAALASNRSSNLKTFSIAYPGDPFSGEPGQAAQTARYLGTEHTEFRYSGKDLQEHLYTFLDHIGEPYGDLSAIQSFILARETRKHVAMVLSGDGADMIFGRQGILEAFHNSNNPGLSEFLLSGISPLLKIFSGHRDSEYFYETGRLVKYIRGLGLNPIERYWLWISILTPAMTNMLLGQKTTSLVEYSVIDAYKYEWLRKLDGSLVSMLATDIAFRLPNELLYKLDMTSMAHGLEVRLPFIDNDLAGLACRLAANNKPGLKSPDSGWRESFKGMLPDHLLKNANKKAGFASRHQFRTDLRPFAGDRILDNSFIREQGIFHPEIIAQIKKEINRRGQGRLTPRLWALIVFQRWWKKNFT